MIPWASTFLWADAAIGASTVWSSWLYHYGLGALLALGTLAVMARQGVLAAGTQERRLAGQLATLLAAFAALHALWIAAVQ